MTGGKIILGVDYGDARTGIAITDPTGTIASGLCTVQKSGKRAVTEEIEKICKEPDDFLQPEARQMFFDTLEEELIAKMKKLRKTKVDVLLENRYKKFRKIGEYESYSKN